MHQELIHTRPILQYMVHVSACLHVCLQHLHCSPHSPLLSPTHRAYADDVHKAERVTLRYPSYHSTVDASGVDMPSAESTIDEQRLPSFVTHTSVAIQPGSQAAVPHAAMHRHESRHIDFDMPDMTYLAPDRD